MTTPSGEHWELYVSKTVLPTWKEGGPGIHESDPWGGAAGSVDLILGLPEAIWAGVVRPLVRAAALLPVAWVRGRRSRAVQIRALSPYPSPRVLLWTTTEGQVDGILEEIAAGLAEGRIVQPAGAVYSGAPTG